MILGALAALFEITGDRAYLTRGEAIAQAALGGLTAAGILAEPCEATGKPCNEDQAQFKGIFVRYLYDFWLQDRQFLLQDHQPDYRAFILANATSTGTTATPPASSACAGPPPATTPPPPASPPPWTPSSPPPPSPPDDFHGGVVIVPAPRRARPSSRESRQPPAPRTAPRCDTRPRGQPHRSAPVARSASLAPGPSPTPPW